MCIVAKDKNYKRRNSCILKYFLYFNNNATKRITSKLTEVYIPERSEIFLVLLKKCNTH